METTLPAPFTLEPLAARGRLYDPTMRPYVPRTRPDGALDGVNVLYALLRDSGRREAWRALIERLRAGLGRGRTVWSATLAEGGRLSFELSFHLGPLPGPAGGEAGPGPAPLRVEDVRAALDGALSWSWAVPADAPVVALGLDVDDEALDAGEVDVLHLGMASGLSYDLSPAGWEYTSHRERFELTGVDALRRLVSHLTNGMAHGSACGVELQHVLLPELYACRAIHLVTRRLCDGVRFAGVDTRQLLWFLREHGWAEHVCALVARHEAALGALRWDVGLDFVASPEGAGRVRWLRRRLHGVF